MPRNLSAALVLSKNTIHSTQSFAYIAEIKYRTALPPSETFASLYYTNYSENIIFNTHTFVSYPISLGDLLENSTGETTRFQLGIGTVDTSFTNVLSTYWLNIEKPLWKVSVWIVDVTQPAQTNTVSNEEYTVITVTTTLLASTMECVWTGLGFETRLPGRRYTTLGGFPHIPRLIR
jgi:hypothetical protein